MKNYIAKGLTLIEVIIVIAVIAFLILFLLPKIPNERQTVVHNVCMANQRSVVISWFMYNLDNDDYLISSDTFANGINNNWVSAPLNKDSQPVEWQNCSQEDEIRGIEKGALYKYYQTAEVLICPTAYKNKKSGTHIGYRTYSITSTLNGTDLPKVLAKHRYTKFDQIKNNAKTIMLVEEADTRGFNYNGWFQNPEQPDTIHDSIGIFHKNSSNFGFCDGHVENIKWKKTKTIEHFENYIDTNTDGNFNFTDPDNEDIQLIHKYYPVNKTKNKD